MNLYEIANEYRSVFDQLSEIPDLNNEIISDTLSPLVTEFNEKAINLTAYFLNLDAEAKAIKKAEELMEKRRKSIENKSKKIEEYLKSQMKVMNINKIPSPHFCITYYKTKSIVKILDEKKIPSNFISVTTTITEKPDKDKILKSGGCEGTEIVENYALRIS